MVVVNDPTFVKADMRLPSRKCRRIQLDLVGHERHPFLRQDDDSTQWLDILVRLALSDGLT
jgi:hypothetical protein